MEKFVPQFAYAGMQRTLQQEWNFIQKVIPNIANLFSSLKASIHTSFFHTLFGEEIPTHYRSWVSVSIKKGGTVIPKPEEMVDLNYLASTCDCSHLLDALKEKEIFDHVYNTATMKEVREKRKKKNLATSDDIIQKVESGMQKKEIRRLNYLKENETGTWLVETLSFVYGTILSVLELRDELRDRYGLKILNTPSYYDSCTSELSTTHALSCKIGELIHSRHDESRDTLGCLACAGFQPSNVRDEPLIIPCRDIGGKNDKHIEPQTGIKLEADREYLLIRRFWDRSTDCIIDVCICDVHQPSYLARNPVNILKSVETSKKTKDLKNCLDQRQRFTPFVVSCESLLGKEADIFLKRLSMKLAEK